MISYYAYDSDGNIIEIGNCTINTLPLYEREGVTIVAGEAHWDKWVDNGELKAKPPKPDDMHRFVKGEWIPDAEKIAWSIRYERDKLLSESDWTQMPDAPVDREAWATYRQALRNLTAQPGFPLEVIWPTKPE